MATVYKLYLKDTKLKSLLLKSWIFSVHLISFGSPFQIFAPLNTNERWPVVSLHSGIHRSRFCVVTLSWKINRNFVVETYIHHCAFVKKSFLFSFEPLKRVFKIPSKRWSYFVYLVYFYRGLLHIELEIFSICLSQKIALVRAICDCAKKFISSVQFRHLATMASFV